MLRRLLNLGLVILLAPLLYAFVYEGVQYLLAVFSFDATKWFLLGAGLGIPASFLVLNSSMAFIEDLIHEMTHAVMFFIFGLQWPSRMEVDPEKGSNVLVSNRGGCLVTLAPYYFPMFTIPFLLIKALAALVLSLLRLPFPGFLAGALDVLIGVTLVFHYMCAIKQFRFYQTDIKSTGYIASIVGVLFLSFVLFVLSLVVVTGTYGESWAYLKAALATTWDTYKLAWGFLRETVVPALQDLLHYIIELFCPECNPTAAS